MKKVVEHSIEMQKISEFFENINFVEFDAGQN